MRATWEVGILELDDQPDLSSLAERLGGSLDNLQSIPAVRLPDDTFVMEFSDKLLGAMAPGNRQQISFWVKRMNRGLSPYLKEAIADLDTKAQVIMALDLENAFSVDDIARGLDKFQSVEKSQLDQAAVAKLLASIKGVTLGINFGDKSYGLLSFDFTEDATLVSSIAKPLTVELLNAYGVMVDEVADWKIVVKGNRISLTGAFTEEGLMRVNSLTHLPSPALHAHATSRLAWRLRRSAVLLQ